MNKYSLFLDDTRQPKDVTWIKLPKQDWVVVKNADEFMTYIKLHGIPARISMDCDLCNEHYGFDWANSNTKPEQLSGVDCVKWLINYCEEHNHQFPAYTLHTMNPVGKYDMEKCIQDYLKHKQYEQHPKQ